MLNFLNFKLGDINHEGFSNLLTGTVLSQWEACKLTPFKMDLKHPKGTAGENQETLGQGNRENVDVFLENLKRMDIKNTD